TNREYRDSLATAHNALGSTEQAAGQLQRAADSFRASIALRETLARDGTANADFRRNLMISYGNLADVLCIRPDQNLGDAAGALAALEKAAALAESARAEDPRD